MLLRIGESSGELKIHLEKLQEKEKRFQKKINIHFEAARGRQNEKKDS